jgi:starch synthase (maltosyl-transferring)
MHLSRYFMAATLSSNTGVYGPVYEMMVSDAVPGREEYMDSEKYAVRHWDWNFENKITVLMAKINRARHDFLALQQTNNIVFCGVDNPQLMAYLKWDDAQTNWVLCVVSFDPYYTQKGTVDVPLHLIGLEGHAHYRVHDVITQNTYDWQGTHNYVEIHPVLPFHLFHLTQ